MENVNFELFKKSISLNGYSTINGFFNAHEIEVISSGYDLLYQRYQASKKLDVCNALDWAIVQKSDVFSILSSDIEKRIKLLGAAYFETNAKIDIGIRIFNKPPNALGTPLHQDKAYELLNKKRRLNIWIPLDDVNEINGALYYLIGSHKNGIFDHDVRHINEVEYLKLNLPSTEYEKAVIVLNKCDLVAHDDTVMHGALPNHSHLNRRAIVIILRIDD